MKRNSFLVLAFLYVCNVCTHVTALTNENENGILTFSAYSRSDDNERTPFTEQKTVAYDLPHFVMRSVSVAECASLDTDNCKVLHDCKYPNFVVNCSDEAQEREVTRLFTSIKRMNKSRPIEIWLHGQRSLTPQMFAPIKESILWLFIYHNDGMTSRYIKNTGLPNLIMLGIVDCKDVQVFKDDLSALPKLRAVTFSRSSITKIEKGSFDNLPSLMLLAIDWDIQHPYTTAAKQQLKLFHCDCEYAWLREFFQVHPILLQPKKRAEMSGVGRINIAVSKNKIFVPVDCENEDLIGAVDQETFSVNDSCEDLSSTGEEEDTANTDYDKPDIERSPTTTARPSRTTTELDYFTVPVSTGEHEDDEVVTPASSEEPSEIIASTKFPLPHFNIGTVSLVECRSLETANCILELDCEYPHLVVNCSSSAKDIEVVRALNNIKRLGKDKPVEVKLHGRRHLTPTLFAPIRENILWLTLSQHDNLTTRMLRNVDLPNLIELDIERSKNIKVLNDDLESFQRLRILTFSRTIITEIEAESFNNLPSLMLLSLEWNLKAPFKQDQNKQIWKFHCRCDYVWLRKLFRERPYLLQERTESELWSVGGIGSLALKPSVIFVPVDCRKLDFMDTADQETFSVNDAEECP